MMPPETWAMPEVMMVDASSGAGLLRRGRGGCSEGASVWPMKMLAATAGGLSAPLVPMVRCMIRRRLP